MAADGVPRRPGAWLTTAARNRAIDVLRRRAVGAAKLREVAALSVDPEPSPSTCETDHSGVPDDRLRLMFTCCHPALSLEARVALTLRTLAGLTTAEIARAFLSSEATMAKRLVRAKQKIAQRRDSLPGAAGAPAAGTRAGRARRALPAVQRGLLGHGRRGPDPAGVVARRRSGWPACWTG